MCICMIAHIWIDCFANASNAYVYTFDCTGSYRLLQMHLMNMFISMIAYIHIDCFAYASNAYTYDCTCLDRLLHTHHPMCKCICMIAHVRIDCFAYASNAYVYTVHDLHMFVFIVTYSLPFLLWKKTRESKCLMYLL
jgi:hypothetical protein